MQKAAAKVPSETSQRVGETLSVTLPVRPRALVVGFVGIVVLCVIVSAGELIAKNIQIGMMQLAPALVGVLFVIVVVNQLLARFAPRWKLTPAELAVAFVLMIPAPMITSRGLMERWLPLLVGVNYYAPGNRWDVLFFPHIPPQLVPWDPAKGARQDVAVWFYERLPGGVALPYAQWVVPLLVWLILILAVYAAFFCMTVILRKHWVEGEKLSFPLVQQTDVLGEVDLGAMVVASGEGNDLEAQKAVINDLALAYNELLPQIPLWERYGNNPAPDIRVTGWPPDGDPVYQNGTYNDPFVIVLLLTGRLQPKQ